MRNFVALAEELHFGRAAKRLSITQPPLSLSIRQLETSLGFELFRRNTRSVELTPAGSVLYREVLGVFGAIAQAETLAQGAARGETGSIRIGCVGSGLLWEGVERLRRHVERSPSIDVQWHELNSFEQVDALQRRRIDVGIAYRRAVPAGLSARMIVREPLVCALPVSHPRARGERIDIAELRDEPFVLFTREFAPEYYDRIAALCARAGFVPRVVHHVRHTLTMTTLVARRFGVAFVPKSVTAIAIDGVAFLPLAQRGAYSELRVLWRSDDESPLLRGILNALATARGVAPAAQSRR